MDIKKASLVSQREDQGTVVNLKDEANDLMVQDDGKTPVTITVVGTYSTRYRKAANANRDRMLKQRATEIDGEQVDQQSLDLVASCILAWDGFTSDGKPYLLTKENAIALLDACPWIRQQVESAMNTHRSFFTRS